MKSSIILILLLILGIQAHAQAPDSCIVYGTFYTSGLVPAAKQVIRIVKTQPLDTLKRYIFSNLAVRDTTDSNGYVSFKVLRNSIIYVMSSDIQGIMSTLPGTKLTIPDEDSVEFSTLPIAEDIPSSQVVVVNLQKYNDSLAAHRAALQTASDSINLLLNRYYKGLRSNDGSVTPIFLSTYHNNGISPNQWGSIGLGTVQVGDSDKITLFGWGAGHAAWLRSSVFIGHGAGAFSRLDQNNVGVGDSALSNAVGYRLTAIGSYAGTNARMERSTFIGSSAGLNANFARDSVGELNVFIGEGCGNTSLAEPSYFTHTTAIGYETVSYGTATYSIALGCQAAEYVYDLDPYHRYTYNIAVGNDATSGSPTGYSIVMGHGSQTFVNSVDGRGFNTTIGNFIHIPRADWSTHLGFKVHTHDTTVTTRHSIALGAGAVADVSRHAVIGGQGMDAAEKAYTSPFWIHQGWDYYGITSLIINAESDTVMADRNDKDTLRTSNSIGVDKRSPELHIGTGANTGNARGGGIFFQRTIYSDPTSDSIAKAPKDVSLITALGAVAQRMEVAAGDTIWHGQAVQVDTTADQEYYPYGRLVVRRASVNSQKIIGIAWNDTSRSVAILGGQNVWVVSSGTTEIVVEPLSIGPLTTNGFMCSAPTNPNYLGYVRCNTSPTTEEIVARIGWGQGYMTNFGSGSKYYAYCSIRFN